MRLEVVTVVKQCLLGKRAWDSAVRLDVTLVELCLLWKRAWDAAVTLDVFVLGLLNLPSPASKIQTAL